MELPHQQTKTVAIKACAVCGSGLLEDDKFCRSCGVRQADKRDPGPRFYRTSALANVVRTEVYRPVSGPLVREVVSGALAGPSAEKQSPVLKRVILALVSIPVWLIIVLLSPLDAYAFVKNLAR